MARVKKETTVRSLLVVLRDSGAGNWMIIAAWLVAGLLVLTLGPGCGGPPPETCTVEKILCDANGGTWVQDPGEECGHCVYPEPPDPNPDPDPDPDPEPWTCDLEMPECGSVGQTCSEPDAPCWHNPTQDLEHCERAPDCEPPHERCPQGKPQARVYWYTPQRKADATPAVCHADWTPECYAGRYCHPVACEGQDASADRAFCEEQLMGGTAPVWELDVQSGDLRLVPDEWFGVVAGSGEGRLRWCFANGATCSKWLEVRR